MSKRDNLLLLQDMLESALKINKYTTGLSFESFLNDEKTIDATVRNFEIIGEAANRLDPDFKIKNASLEWNRIRGFRNRIVHDYFGIDYDIVWSVIENDIEGLIDSLSGMIENYKNSSGSE